MTRKVLTEWPTELPEGRWEYRPRDNRTGEALEPLRGVFVQDGPPPDNIGFFDDEGFGWERYEFKRGESFVPVAEEG
jgi:hypothetical protein